MSEVRGHTRKGRRVSPYVRRDPLKVREFREANREGLQRQAIEMEHRYGVGSPEALVARDYYYKARRQRRKA